MKHFLDNRQNIEVPGSEKSGASAFRKLGGEGAAELSSEAVPRPEHEPEGPQVEVIRDGEVVVKIIVTFGDQKVEIECDY